jgi:hypothetical protein
MSGKRWSLICAEEESSFESYLSKEREKTSLIRISKDGLQVDLEEEFSKGDCHVEGKF